MPAQLCGETTTSHFICCSQLRTHLQGRGVHHLGWAKLTAWDERKKREPSIPSQDRSSVVCSVPGHGAQQPVVLGDSGDSQAQTRQGPSSQQCPASSSCSHRPTQLLAGPYSHSHLHSHHQASGKWAQAQHRVPDGDGSEPGPGAPSRGHGKAGHGSAPCADPSCLDAANSILETQPGSCSHQHPGAAPVGVPGLGSHQCPVSLGSSAGTGALTVPKAQGDTATAAHTSAPTASAQGAFFFFCLSTDTNNALLNFKAPCNHWVIFNLLKRMP